MPDTGLPALDVLIGMALLSSLLATVVASVNEVIQSALGARARMLVKGIKTLLRSPGQGSGPTGQGRHRSVGLRSTDRKQNPGWGS